MVVTSLLLVSAILRLSYGTNSCQTPDGQPGDCKSLNDCPELDSFLNLATTSQSAAIFLRKSHCGVTGRHPKVCCPNRLLPGPESCGIHLSGKIIGGKATDLDEFPWMALLQYQLDDGTRTFECGGSLISKRYVLTAAHCLLPSLVNVRLGEYNTVTNPDCITTSFSTDCAPPAIDFGIEKKIPHISYNSNSFYHDIGLIRLDRDVQFSDFIKPICLPLTPDEIHKSYRGQHLTISGWGVTERGVKSTIKLKVQVPVQDLDECGKKYRSKKPDLFFSESQMCAGGVKGKDSCSADSGGPLMSLKFDKKKDSRFYAVGVVSFGPNPCAQEGLPAVYTKVAKYGSWIVDQIRP